MAHDFKITVDDETYSEIALYVQSRESTVNESMQTLLALSIVKTANAPGGGVWLRSGEGAELERLRT